MQHSTLGLSHNPFVPPQDGFYTGGDRDTYVDQLRHLSQWSRRLMVVTGPHGIGKSAVYRQLSNNLEPQTRGARLAGNLATSEREVLFALIQGFGVEADVSAHVDDITEIIIKYIEEQHELDWICVAMVDDAHQLHASAIKRLLDIAASSSLRLVFFTEASLIDTIAQIAPRLELEWFEDAFQNTKPGHQLRQWSF